MSQSDPNQTDPDRTDADGDVVIEYRWDVGVEEHDFVAQSHRLSHHDTPFQGKNCGIGSEAPSKAGHVTSGSLSELPSRHTAGYPGLGNIPSTG